NAIIETPTAVRSRGCGPTSVFGEEGNEGFAGAVSVALAGFTIGGAFVAAAAASCNCRCTMAGSRLASAQETLSPPSHPFRKRSAMRPGSSLTPARRLQLFPSPAAQAFSRRSAEALALGAVP